MAVCDNFRLRYNPATDGTIVRKPSCEAMPKENKVALKKE